MSTASTESQSTVGISLSGGGLRAASFGLGALQALHDEHGLIRGPRSADWISAVSGGSYIAGAVTLLNAGRHARCRPTKSSEPIPVTAIDLPAGDVPFSNGSPELRHVHRHCRYLVEDGGLRIVAKIALLVMINVVTLLVLFAWAGAVLIGTVDFYGMKLLPPTSRSWIGSGLAAWAIGLTGPCGMLLAFRAVSSRPARREWTMLVLGTAVALWATPVLVGCLEASPIFRSPTWALENLSRILLFLLGFGVVVAGSNYAGRWHASAPLRLMVNAVVAAIMSAAPWSVAVVLVAWSGMYFVELFRTVHGNLMSLAVLGGIAIAAILTYPLPGLFSPHRPYRTLLSRCFIVRRTPDGEVEPVEHFDSILLSSLAPDNDNPATKFPALLICAAANVSDRGATPAGSNVLPLVVTSENVSIPGHPAATIPTTELEKILEPRTSYPLVPKKPMISLARAIALTGAAISPSMGRLSRPRLRPVLAALNVRLGAWIPNPLSEAARRAVRHGNSNPFTVGVDQLIWEFLGRNPAKSQLLYVSDGGHYENLGMVELIRRKASTIWAIDASGSLPNPTSTLVHSILLAESETGCSIDIDLTSFDREPPSGLTKSACAEGRVCYSDGSTATLHVIRIGLTAAHSTVLHKYALEDPGFPHHSTLRQVYRAERFEAYRRLGAESVRMMLEDRATRVATPEATTDMAPGTLPPRPPSCPSAKLGADVAGS